MMTNMLVGCTSEGWATAAACGHRASVFEWQLARLVVGEKELGFPGFPSTPAN